MGEKAAERNLPPEQRTYKARVVFAGNAIQTSSGVPDHELFQDVSSAPAAMMTVRSLLAAYTCQMKDFLWDAAEEFMEETGVKHLAATLNLYPTEKFDSKANAVPCVHAKTASSHLMKLLYAARLCRPDLTVAITRLAAKVTSWNTSHDRSLKRLMQYCHHKRGLDAHGQSLDHGRR